MDHWRGGKSRWKDLGLRANCMEQRPPGSAVCAILIRSHQKTTEPTEWSRTMSRASDHTSKLIDPEQPHEIVKASGQAPVILYVDVYPYWIDPGSGEARFLALHRHENVQLGDTWQPVCGKIKT